MHVRTLQCGHLLQLDRYLNNIQASFYVCVSVHRNSILYKEPTRCNFGSIVYQSLQDYSTYRHVLLKQMAPFVLYSAVATDLGYPYWIYIIRTHGMHQWLLLQFLILLMMDAESVRNMQSNLAVTNKRYCQSCILLVPYIIQSYDARKIKHKKKLCQCYMFGCRLYIK